MRWIAGAFGLICGAVVVVLVGRYGFITSDNETNGMIAAFLFAVMLQAGSSVTPSRFTYGARTSSSRRS